MTILSGLAGTSDLAWARQARGIVAVSPLTYDSFVDEETPSVLPPPTPPEVLENDGVPQCLPYTRFMSGVGLHGDAWTWWDQASGIHASGNRPEPGAVLSFPGNDRILLGHVAVVTQVLSARKILVDHANWPNAIVQHGAISHDVQVADVSPGNDWTGVRVQFGECGPKSSVYPANGFIYGWSEIGAPIAHAIFARLCIVGAGWIEWACAQRRHASMGTATDRAPHGHCRRQRGASFRAGPRPPGPDV